MEDAGFETIDNGFKNHWNPDVDAQEAAIKFGKKSPKHKFRFLYPFNPYFLLLGKNLLIFIVRIIAEYYSKFLKKFKKDDLSANYLSKIAPKLGGHDHYVRDYFSPPLT